MPLSSPLLLLLAYQAREALGPDPHLECVLPHVDPLYEQLHDPSLLSGRGLVAVPMAPTLTSLPMFARWVDLLF
jgi:hypothetical protein